MNKFNIKDKLSFYINDDNFIVFKNDEKLTFSIEDIINDANIEFYVDFAEDYLDYLLNLYKDLSSQDKELCRQDIKNLSHLICKEDKGLVIFISKDTNYFTYLSKDNKQEIINILNNII